MLPPGCPPLNPQIRTDYLDAQEILGNPGLPLKGSSKGDIDIGIDIDVDVMI